MLYTTSFEDVPQILAEAHAAVRKVQGIWPGWIPAEETDDAIVARYSGNDTLCLAWHEIQRIGAHENPTSDEVWTANRWLDCVLRWVGDQQRRADELHVA